MRSKIETELLMSELVYKHLSGEITADEQAILDSWVENEENTAFFESLKETDRLYQGMIGEQYQDTEAQFRKLQKKIERKNSFRRWPWWMGITAILVMGVGIGWMFRKQPQSRVMPVEMVRQTWTGDRTRLKTPEGKVIYLADSVREIVARDRNVKAPPLVIPQPPTVVQVLKYNVLATSSRGKIEVMLSDSSRVWLNAGSELKYPDVFGQDSRMVYLKGEAYFEVAKNPRRPFIVNTGDTKIEVLGTRFNVRAREENRCITTLVEGCVQMRNSRESVILSPCQRAETAADGKIRVKTVDVRYDIAWKKDRFAFQEETLFSILKELSEWYDFTFDFEDISLANQVYTAILPRSPEVDDVLHILQRTEDFVYRCENGNRHIVIRKN